MPIINRVGGGAGGAGGLNFTVKQYTSTPTGSAAENTIGIVTETPISGWVMQAEEPAASAGLVWIEVAAVSDVAFYADKKQMVKLYPKAVMQYVGGAWANTEAYVYQKGWVQFSQSVLFLFDEGDQCTNVTGGWGLAGYDIGDGIGGFTASSDSMSIQSVINSHYGWAGTLNAVDVTNFSRLCFNGYVNTTDPANKFGLGPRKDGEFLASVTPSLTTQDTFVDISDVSGLQYIKFMSGGNSKITVYKVWME